MTSTAATSSHPACVNCGRPVEHLNTGTDSRWIHTLTGWSLCDPRQSPTMVAIPTR